MKVDRFTLKVTAIEPLLGTQPQKDVATEFIQDKAREAGLDVADEQETLPEMLEKGTTVFHRLNGTPIYYDYHIKGFLKEAGKTFNGKINGVKNLRNKIDSLVFIRPRRIELHLPEGGESSYIERPLRAETMQGPRVTLARSECLPEGTWFECEVEVLEGQIDEALLRELLEYGRYKGLGQWRNGGYGRFEYELTAK